MRLDSMDWIEIYLFILFRWGWVVQVALNILLNSVQCFAFRLSLLRALKILGVLLVHLLVFRTKIYL